MTFEDSIDHGEAIIDQLLGDVIALDDYRRQSIALGFSDAAAQRHVEDVIHELNELRISYDDPFLRPRPSHLRGNDRCVCPCKLVCSVRACSGCNLW